MSYYTPLCLCPLWRRSGWADRVENVICAVSKGDGSQTDGTSSSLRWPSKKLHFPEVSFQLLEERRTYIGRMSHLGLVMMINY